MFSDIWVWQKSILPTGPLHDICLAQKKKTQVEEWLWSSGSCTYNAALDFTLAQLFYYYLKQEWEKYPTKLWFSSVAVTINLEGFFFPDGLLNFIG